MKKISGSLVMALLIITAHPVKAQKKKTENDNNYYETQKDKLTVRLFGSQKYVHLNIPSNGTSSDLEYKANPLLNIGAGVSYKGFSLNIFNGFGLVNNRRQEKGKTKGLDLQLQLFPKKWAITILGEFPKGFHIEPKGVAGADPGSYYYRPDIQSSHYGIAAFRVPNKEKFSYRAAFQQTEWQKKSAGSFLFGGTLIHGAIHGDSALVPALLSNAYPEAGIEKIYHTTIGPGVGYAHTFVVDQHFFITGSLIINGVVNFVSEEGITKQRKTSVGDAEVFKAALGYNSEDWNVSASWAGQGFRVKGSSTNENYFFPSGNIRLVVAHKFHIHKHHSS